MSAAHNIDIARVCHEANRAWCEACGDYSQPRWDDAPQWQRDSALLGVQFNLENPNAPASASHDSWLEQKRQDGWAYGPEKNPDAKLHPCFVSYDELPFEQRAKDNLFKAIVRGLAES